MAIDYSVFDTAEFDNDSFDFDSHVGEADKAVEDAEQIILENGTMVRLFRQTKTIDGMGKATAVTETVYDLACIIQPITSKDRDIHNMGLALQGHKKMYTMGSPTCDSGSFLPLAGDTIKDRDVEYRIVEEVYDPQLADEVPYRKFIIRLLNQEDMSE